MQTKAAVLHQLSQPLRVETLELDAPGDGEVLVRMVGAGVCHSDWLMMTGVLEHPVPVVPGHEGAGIVEDVGKDVTRVRPGDHVVLDFIPRCGRCSYCSRGQDNLCPTYQDVTWGGTMMDGTIRMSLNGERIHHWSALSCFSQWVVVPKLSCVPLPPEVPLETASLIGCAVTTGVGAVLNRARVEPGSHVVVFGAGGVGLSIIMGAKLASAGTITAIDIEPSKESMALAMGATGFWLSGPETVERIRELTQGRGADYVFDATGSPAVQARCLDLTRPGGTVVLVGSAPPDATFPVSGRALMAGQKAIVGCYYGSATSARDFRLYADLYLRGQLDLDRLVTRPMI